jgi:hypothetical protein
VDTCKIAVAPTAASGAPAGDRDPAEGVGETLAGGFEMGSAFRFFLGGSMVMSLQTMDGTSKEADGAEMYCVISNRL